MRKMIFGALATCVLAACATAGKPIDVDQVKQLRPGVSTITDAERIFGQPMSTTHNTDGTTQLFYEYSSEKMDPKSFIPIVGTFVGHGPKSHTQYLALIFDSNGHYLNHTDNEQNIQF
ncbi:MAG: hypothetical protein B7X39_14190 [Lysobacterales bacterium 14-68-21]|jgi:hypothetical protein|nr:MAG: hypothetical protein B7X45_13080 [Xanthomonadales bacterium 15-68-25]OZB65396.1 MAG: hypothetical protein B7X39_14190 [Xanthomonadales bacterium 14-68-21]